MPKVRILSLDGGGLRGAFSAAFLAHLEKQLSQPLVKHFDLIAGTSTGAIIALGLAAGLSAAEILDFYRKKGPLIFPRPAGIWRRTFGPGHDGTALRSALRDVFGSKTLSDALVKVAVPTLDLATGQTRVWKTDHHPDLHGGGALAMWEVALASAAAPTFLPPVQIGGMGAFVDGGLWANNPSIVAIVEALKYCNAALKDIVMLSVGTGRQTKWYGFEDLLRRGVLGWGRDLFSVVSSAQSLAAVNQATLLIEPGQFLRVDVDLARSIGLDDAREITHLEHLGNTAGLNHRNGVKALIETQ